MTKGIRYEVSGWTNGEKRVYCSTPHESVAQRSYRQRVKEDPNVFLALDKIESLQVSGNIKEARGCLEQ